MRGSQDKKTKGQKDKIRKAHQAGRLKQNEAQYLKKVKESAEKTTQANSSGVYKLQTLVI